MIEALALFFIFTGILAFAVFLASLGKSDSDDGEW